ncbi:MAG: hypothetical protein IT361_04085 [Gemmatimonadaceae bacterium]|nr:hypothetical protein [Gemmatimonadaceae bacterium]
MPGRHLPPDHDRGDANTIGGYEAVHGRPAAFEGRDGMSYSVSLDVEATGEEARPWGAYFLFLRWRRMGGQGVEGHVETDFLVYGATAAAARAALGAWPLAEVRVALDAAILAAGGGTGRRWWDVMREEE